MVDSTKALRRKDTKVVCSMSWICSMVDTRQLVIPCRHASLRLTTWTSREHHLTAGISILIWS